MARRKKLMIPYDIKSTFFWTLGITLFLSLSLFVLLGFSASSYPRLIIAVLTPAIVAVVLTTVFSNLPRWFKEKWIVLPLLLLIIPLIGQWFIFGTAFSRSSKGYELNNGDRVSLPIFGSCAYFDGENIKAKRSYFSEEVEINISNLTPKAIGISLFGDRIAVRFHSGYGKSGGGTRVFFSTKTGKPLGAGSWESGHWHSPLYLLW